MAGHVRPMVENTNPSAVYFQARFQLACYQGDDSRVRALLQSSALSLIRPLDIDRQEASGMTPLFMACTAGHSACVKLLLAAGAKINASTGAQTSELVISSVLGHHECVHLLLEAGVRPSDNHDALFMASQKNHVECVKLLVAAGAPLNRAGESHSGVTALIVACLNGNVESARVLCEARADVNQAKNDGVTPLLLACLERRTDCARLLIDYGALPDKPTNRGMTALIVACQEGIDSCVPLLLNAGASIEQTRGSRFDTPLQLSCTNGHYECARLLLERGASVNRVQDNGNTALVAACVQGHADIVKLLSSFKAPRDFTLHGTTANVEAVTAHQGHLELTEWLVASRGWEPLHHLEVLTAERARTLLRGGSDPHSPADAPLQQHVYAMARTTITPAERAATVHGPASEVVLLACRPWHRANHELYPTQARARAVELLRLGQQLSSQPRFAGEAQAVVDVWIECIMPHVVRRWGLADEIRERRHEEAVQRAARRLHVDATRAAMPRRRSARLSGKHDSSKSGRG